jgi:ubiquinone/menaquinone biosynthesis C-methylase UbiE
MAADSDISKHYTSGDLAERLQLALADDGVEQPTIETLAPYDQFHGRGLEATREIAEGLSVAASDDLLDIGSGIGGPARYFADYFGCRVTGIDLTAEFCDLARHLTQLLGLEDRVAFQQGNALAMPFDDARFDGAYSMNVSMNIADKAAFYREIFRVLRPGAWLVLSELARGPNDGMGYPTPWARTAASSFLETPSATAQGLEACGFTHLTLRDHSKEFSAFSVRSRALVERGEKPPHRAVQLIHGDNAVEVMANTARGVADSCLVPIEILCWKPSGF